MIGSIIGLPAELYLSRDNVFIANEPGAIIMGEENREPNMVQRNQNDVGTTAIRLIKMLSFIPADDTGVILTDVPAHGGNGIHAITMLHQ